MAVFSRSWSLFTATWQVLKAEKTFVLYPIFAAVAALLVTALALGAGVAFLAAHPELEQTLRADGPQGDVPTWVTAVALGLLFLYMGAAFAVALFLTLLATIGLVGLAGQAQLPALAALVLLVGGTCLVVLVVLNTTLMGIYRGAVYLYAEQGQVAPQFDRSVITQAFAPRSR